MGLGLKKTTLNESAPVFQAMHETAQGGFKLDTTDLVAGAILVAGTPIAFDEATRLAKPVKTAVLQADAANNATNYRVKKGHLLKVGENFGATKGGAAYAITAIDTSNPAYDQLTLGTTLGVALTTGTSLFQSSATGGSAAAVSGVAKGLLFEDTEVEANQSLSVVLRGTVYERRIPGVPDEIKAVLPNIIFSKSF